MPNLPTITVNDRETTPVAHAFTPDFRSNGTAYFYEAGATLVGQNKLTISSRDTGTNVKVRVKTEMPVVQTETVNGISNDVIVRRLVADTNITLPKSSTLQERKNLIGMHFNVFDAGSQATVDLVVTAVEKWY